MELRRLACGLVVEVATTEEEWQRGLSNRPILVQCDGMLFVFPVSKRWPVSMEQMSCSLNAYWLDEHGTLVSHAWMPKDSSVYYLPKIPCRYVLETPYQMPWSLGDQIALEDVHDKVGSPNPHS